MTAMDNELITSSQAAALAGTTRQNILRWMVAGRLAPAHVSIEARKRPLYLFAREAVLAARDTTLRPGGLLSARAARIAETPATDYNIPQSEGTNET